MLEEELTERVIGAAMKVHSTLGPGYRESTYHNALAYELQKRGVPVEREKSMQVFYEDIVVGDFAPDMMVEHRLLIELKAVEAIVKAHEVQVVHYLTATRIDVGLLLNFGAEKLQFRRKLRKLKKAETSENFIP